MDDWSFAGRLGALHERLRTRRRTAPVERRSGGGARWLAHSVDLGRHGSPPRGVRPGDKSAELARRLADVQAEARLVAQTKQGVNIEFMRCKQTIERAYISVLCRRPP